VHGELLISIFELMMMICFLQVEVQEAYGLEETLAQQLNESSEKIFSFNPTQNVDRSIENDKADGYRHACNAAQALSYLSNRRNSRIADRLAILANLANYPIRLDTTKLEMLQIDFNICDFALAVMNGDLSMTYSDPSPGQNRLGFSWGPSRGMRLLTMPFYEDRDEMNRLKPATITPSRLLVRGWLWETNGKSKVTDASTSSHDSINVHLGLYQAQKTPDPGVTAIWQSIRTLLNQDLFYLGRCCMEGQYFRTHQSPG
jgi:hypothetical protein